MKPEATEIPDDSDFSIKLNDANNKIINVFIAISLLIAGFIIIFYWSEREGFELLQYFQFFLFFLLFAIYITKSKTSFKFRIYSALTLLALFTFSAAINNGMLGFWNLEMVLFILIISVFAKKRYTFIVLALLTLILVIIAYLFTEKYLTLNFNITGYIESYRIWLAMVITFLFVSTAIIFIVGIQRKFYISSLKQTIIAKENADVNEQKFKKIFNSSLDGVLISDINGTILEVNTTLCSFLGSTEEKIKHRKTLEFITPEYHDIILDRQLRLRSENRMPLQEISVINVSTYEFLPVELNTVAIDLNTERVYLTVLRDITTRKSVERRILNSIIATEEKERSRFAREIHDGVGPLLSAAKIYINSLKDAKDEDREYAYGKLNEIIEEAILSAKEVSNNLSPHILKNFGLKGAVESFILKVNQNKNTKFVFNTNVETRLEEDLEVTLYRIIVELINNSIKYAEATTIQIDLTKNSEKLSLSYVDDGNGINLNEMFEQQKGMGLANIKSRIKSLDGNVNFWSELGKGFKTFIEVNLIQ